MNKMYLVKWIFLTVILFAAFLNNVICLSGGRVCSKTETYTAYHSEQRIRYWNSYYSECCSRDWWGACNGYCQRSRTHSEYYTVSVASTMTRIAYYCCPGFTKSGTTCVGDGSWSSWASSGCSNKNIVGRRTNKHTRTCQVSNCAHGENTKYKKTCNNAYYAPAVKSGSERSQCTNCHTYGYFDADFSVNFLQFGWNSPKKIKIFAKTKTAANGKFDLGIDKLEFSTSYNSSDSINARNNIQGLDDLAVNVETKYNDYIYNRIESDIKEMNFASTAQREGNKIRFNIKSRVTGNPNPDSETYISAGFKVWGESSDPEDSGEVVTVIQYKTARATNPTDSPNLVVTHEFDQVVYNTFKYPGMALYFENLVQISGKTQMHDVISKTRIPMCYSKADYIFLLNVHGVPVIEEELSLTKEVDHEKGSFNYHIPMFDPIAFPLKLVGVFNVNPDTEFLSTTYLAHPMITYVVDYSFCPGGNCNNNTKQASHITKRSEKSHPSLALYKVTKEYKRIKHIDSGMCWTISGVNVVLTSKCQDLFMFTSRNEVIHKETGKKLNIDRINMLLHVSEYHAVPIALVDGITLAMKWSNREASCLTASGSTLQVQTKVAYESLQCANNNANLVTLLADYSQHYSFMDMKNILQTQLTTGSSIFVVCEPVSDLASKSNCRYTYNKGDEWKAITSIVTHIKFYLTDDGLFYGYCFQGKHQCSWNINNGEIKFVSADDFNSKSASVNAYATEGLDGRSLTTTPSQTDDSTIGISSNGIYKWVSSSWQRFYIWKN